MNIDDYQKQIHELDLYPKGIIGLSAKVIGLANEAGEVGGVLKKVIRDKEGLVDFIAADKMKKELGDTLWYLAAIATEIGFSLSEVAEANLDKLFDRKERGVLQGSGDNR